MLKKKIKKKGIESPASLPLKKKHEREQIL